MKNALFALFASAVALGVFADGRRAVVSIAYDRASVSSTSPGVTGLEWRKDSIGQYGVFFDYAPADPSAKVTLSVANLPPKNWILLHDDMWQLGKWTIEELAAGVDVGALAPGRYELGKKGGQTKPADWDEWKASEVFVKSTADGTMQPSFLRYPEKAKTEKVPLLVALHSWSYGYTMLDPASWAWSAAKKNGWALLYPHFRGPNNTPEGCGSDLAVQDIADAVEFAKRRICVDEDRVYLLGGSGGGHMALLMAARHPEIWAGVYSACPISDIARWYRESSDPGRNLFPNYARMIAKSCGGTPEEKPAEYSNRSPVTHLPSAKGKVFVDICTGIHDGHRKPGGGSVPCGHAIRAYNCLADEKDRVGEDLIAEMEKTESVPDGELFRGKDPFFQRRIFLRRVSGGVRLTVFDAGHSGNYAEGVYWFNRQRRGKPVDWTLPESAEASAIREVTK